MADDKTQIAIVKGARAKAKLDDETFNDAFKQVREGLMEQWTICADPAGRDRAWIAVNLLEQIKSALINTASNGRVAQADLDAMTAREPKAA